MNTEAQPGISECNDAACRSNDGQKKPLGEPSARAFNPLLPSSSDNEPTTSSRSGKEGGGRGLPDFAAMVDGGEDKYKVEVLKNALKSAADERKQLLLQVSELKKELGRRGSSSKGGGAGGKDETDSSAELWSVDAGGIGGSQGAARSESSSNRAATSDASASAAAARYQVNNLEAKIAAREGELRELRSMLTDRDAAVAKLQQRNGTLSAKLEEREQQISLLEQKVVRLQTRLHQSNAYAPPAWMSKDGGKESGASLGTMELLQQAPSSAAKWHEDDLERVSLVPGYREFEEKLNDKSAAPLVGMIDSFVQALQLKNPKLSDHSMVHNFLGAMENPFRTNKLWKGCEDGDVDEAMDCLEKKILSDDKVYQSIVSNMGQSWEQMDASFEKKKYCLEFLQPSHLDVRRSLAMHPALTLARRLLDRMDHVRAPQEKLECIFRSARLIFRMLNESAAISNSEAASADDFLPILIFTVLRSTATHLHSTIEYVSLFRRPPRLGGERHYYLVQLQTAVTFIQHLDHRSVTIDETEYKTSFANREAMWEAMKQRNSSLAGEGVGDGAQGAGPSGLCPPPHAPDTHAAPQPLIDFADAT